MTSRCTLDHKRSFTTLARWLLVAAAVLLGLLYLLMPDLAWDGAAAIEIDVTVTSAADNRPITGATVSLVSSLSPDSYFSRRAYATDSAGRATVLGYVLAGGAHRGVYRTTRLNMEHYSIRVEAAGYETAEEFLSPYDGTIYSNRDRKPRLSVAVKLRLERPAPLSKH